MIQISTKHAVVICFYLIFDIINMKIDDYNSGERVKPHILHF